MAKPPKIEMHDNMTSILTKSPEIFDDQFLRGKEFEEIILEQIKSDFDFDKVVDSFDRGKVLESLTFFYGAKNRTFYLKCQLLLLLLLLL